MAEVNTELRARRRDTLKLVIEALQASPQLMGPFADGDAVAENLIRASERIAKYILADDELGSFLDYKA